MVPIEKQRHAPAPATTAGIECAAGHSSCQARRAGPCGSTCSIINVTAASLRDSHAHARAALLPIARLKASPYSASW